MLYFLIQMKYQLSFLLIFLILEGCNKKEKVAGFVSIPKTGWIISQPLEFYFPVSDTLEKVNFQYELAYAPEFPWENIWLRYSLEEPDGDTLAFSTDNLFLFEPGSGRPLGRGPAEGLYLNAWFLKNVRFRKTGKHRLKVWQRSRTDTLQGIQSLAVRLFRDK